MKTAGAAASKKKQPEITELPATVMESPQKKIFPNDLGKRYKCYKCCTMFYDLGRPEPLCPSCGVNQNDAAKGIHKRKRGRRWSATLASAEDRRITAPIESGDVIEAVDEGDAECCIDMDDIVFDEHTDTDNSDE